MPLYAIAGGTPSGETLHFFCCCPPCLFLLFLSTWGVYRRSIAITWAAFVLSCMAFALLLNEVAGHAPSDDWEVEAEQATTVKAAYAYGVLVVGMGAALLAVFWLKQRAKATRL